MDENKENGKFATILCNQLISNHCHHKYYKCFGHWFFQYSHTLADSIEQVPKISASGTEESGHGKIQSNLHAALNCCVDNLHH